MQTLMRDAGLGPKTFHGLRQRAATLLLTMGVRLEVIQETLGHASFRTTRDLYAHVLPEIQRDAADRMNTFLSRWSEARRYTLEYTGACARRSEELIQV
jgi:integrase